MTESEMKAIREMFREMGADVAKQVEQSTTLRQMMRDVVVDEVGKATRALEDRLGDRFVALESGIRSEIAELRGEVAEVKSAISSLESDMAEVKGDVKTVIARLDVNEDDVRTARVKLALLARERG